MLNVGIVGLGYMAAMHIKAWRQVEGAEILAICNPSGRNLDGDLSSVFGNLASQEDLKLDMKKVRAYSDYAAMLADPDIHIIDICSPTWAHHDQATSALASGVHVLLEKPVARTTKEAKRIVEASGHASHYLMPAMCLRFWPEWKMLKDAMDDGRYGKVLAARFRRVGPPPAWGKSHFHDGIKSGGALLDLHIHDVDFINWCFGKPKRVFSSGYSKFSGSIDHVVSQFEVGNGAIVHAEGGWAMTPGFDFNMSYTVNFEKGTMDYDVARGPEAVLKIYEEGKDPVVHKASAMDGYLGEIRYFVDCVKEGKPPSLVTAADGLSAIEVCEAEEMSIRLHQPMTV
ncbi:gfo/Idh/MocA family oxidoreductase [bacterium]|nr:gfo/Idh/MocA family oxidoreductase [bacterium]